MLEALWSVTFQSNAALANNAGGGIAVLETGRILGGDIQFTYIGTFSAPAGGQIEAEVECTRYRDVPGTMSVFGPLKKFRLRLTGTAQRERMLLHGHVLEHPDMRIAIELVRRGELP